MPHGRREPIKVPTHHAASNYSTPISSCGPHGRMKQISQIRFNFRTWFRLALFTSALIGVLFVATGGSLWHFDTPGSAASCPICHVGKMPVLGGMPGAVLTALKPVRWVPVPLK